ncbi:MAG: hypothetical protein WCJ64_13445, partial [Rhodospirillaceae bacterium]
MMCSTCGCGGGGATFDDGKAQPNVHEHDPEHIHEHVGADGTVIRHSHEHCKNDNPVVSRLGHDHEHDYSDLHGLAHREHEHHHPLGHSHESGSARILRVEQDVLAKNNACAASKDSPANNRFTLVCWVIW